MNKLGQRWSMAIRNLSRNKRRNTATGIAVGLGFAALLALGGYINRVENHLRVYTLYALRTGHITIYKHDGFERYSVKPRDFSLTASDQTAIRDALKELPGIELHGAQLHGSGLVGNGCRTVPFLATGVDPELDRALKKHPEMRTWGDDRIKMVSKGRALSEYPPDVGAIQLADGLARLLHKQKVHDEFPAGQAAVFVTDCLAPDAKDLIASDANVQLAAGSWSGMMSALDGEVVATYNPGTTETMNSALLTSLSHLQKLYDTENVTLYSIWLEDPKQLTATIAKLGTLLKAKGLDVDIYPWDIDNISPMYTGTMQFLYTMVTFIAVVLAVVIVFSVFNSATMTVIERSQEIGMMRSLGFTRGEIRRLFVNEMLALAFLSVIGGGIIGTIGILLVNAANIHLNPPGVAGGIQLKLVPNLLTIFGSASVIFFLAVLTTLTAVKSVAQQNIATLLMGTHR